MLRESGIIDRLGENERVVADSNYANEAPDYVLCPQTWPVDEDSLFREVLLRSEQIKGHLKTFKCLSGRFRHNDEKHAACFRAVVVITQLAMDDGERLLRVVAN